MLTANIETVQPIALSIREAAKALRLSERTVATLLKNGRLGFSRIGRRVIIPRAAIERLLVETAST